MEKLIERLSELTRNRFSGTITMSFYKGSLSKIIYQLQGGLRSSMGYIGAKKLSEINNKATFIKITKAGFYESMVHSVEMTQKTINYKL